MNLRAQLGYCDRTAVTSWQIKKLYKVPEFPSKRLPNWRARGLEHRRQGLEAYIQVGMGLPLLPPTPACWTRGVTQRGVGPCGEVGRKSWK